MREQTGSSQSACDRSRWRRGFDDYLALAAGELRPHMPDHPEALREHNPAVRKRPRRSGEDHRRTPGSSCCFGSWVTTWRGRCSGSGLRAGFAPVLSDLRIAHRHRRQCRVDRLHLLQLQFELIELHGELLALPAEEHPAQLLHHQLQVFDLLGSCGQLGLMLSPARPVQLSAGPVPPAAAASLRVVKG